MAPIKVLVVDDHEIVRRAVVSLIAGHPEFEVVGEACDGESAVEKVKALHPDLVLLDMMMPKLNGLLTMRLILAFSPLTEVLVLSQYDSNWMVSEAARTGARGYVLKSEVGNVLLNAMATVSQHQSFFKEPSYI